VSTLEWIAAIAGAVSVYLSARENIWSWPTAIVNVGLYIVVFRRAGLYSDMGLQVVYLILSIYGWYEWLYGGANRTQLVVSRATRRQWLLATPIALIFWLLLARYTATLSGVALPYLDSGLTTVSLVAQWMMTQEAPRHRGTLSRLSRPGSDWSARLVAQLGWSDGNGTADRGVKRVVLTGSESTGKTTLARRLAEHYGAAWVPEFVRDYAAAKATPLTFEDHGPIARGQIQREDEYIARSRASGAAVLFQDTDLLSTAVYCAHYYGTCPAWIERAIHERRPDLYLLLDIDIPWEADPQRDRGHMRPEMQALFADAVRRSGAPFVVIRGLEEARVDAARAAIEHTLTFR
jgi:nicotinamide mononucleotide transporter PnuC